MKRPVHIPRPCPMKWDSLAGDDQQRHCEQCGHAVHNLSHMTAGERRALFADRTTTPCVAYETDTRGRFIEHRKRPTTRSFARLGSILASMLPILFASCASRQMMGTPCPPPETTPDTALDDKTMVFVGEAEPEPLWRRLWPW